MAGGAGEATCPACHVRDFMVVVQSRRSGRAKVPVESAGEFVTVGRKQVEGASVGNIWRVLAEVLVEFSGPGEGSQVSRVSEKDRVCVNNALVHRLLSFNYPERVPLNGTWSLAAAGVDAETNTAAKQRLTHACGLEKLKGIQTMPSFIRPASLIIF